MKLLPPVTRLPDARIVRRHRPKPGPYATYRACLEWEFGFFCAFCFIHATDLNEHGLDGLGMMSIEHKIPRSENKKLENDYRNCFYCCRFCNRARSDRPVVSPAGHRLMDPCETVWADEFTPHKDTLAPATEAARHTCDSYDLNDPRKVVLRKHRRRALDEAFRVAREVPGMIAQLLSEAETATDSERRVTSLAMAKELRGLLLRAVREMRRFTPIPRSATPTCRCKSAAACTLPTFAQEQLVEMPPART